MKKQWKTPVMEVLDIGQTMGGDGSYSGDCMDASNNGKCNNPGEEVEIGS